jgi:hypothetical protein
MLSKYHVPGNNTSSEASGVYGAAINGQIER